MLFCQDKIIKTIYLWTKYVILIKFFISVIIYTFGYSMF